MLYSITLSGAWMDGGVFLKLCASNPVGSLERMILLSDGSLTRLLNAFLLSPITLLRLNQEEIPLGDEMAGYIGAKLGQSVIDRDVWLMSGGEKVVYANSILPTSLMREGVYNGINKGDTPIGELLSEQSILTMRDRLQIGRVASKAISVELGLAVDTVFWARRYRLNTEGGFKGAIIEVFSPKLFEV